MANTKVVVQDASGYARPAGATDTLVDGNSQPLGGGSGLTQPQVMARGCGG